MRLATLMRIICYNDQWIKNFLIRDNGLIKLIYSYFKMSKIKTW